jgi:hypothetical protein
LPTTEHFAYHRTFCLLLHLFFIFLIFYMCYASLPTRRRPAPCFTGSCTFGPRRPRRLHRPRRRRRWCRCAASRSPRRRCHWHPRRAACRHGITQALGRCSPRTMGRDVGAEEDREEDLGWLEVWTLARICWAAGSFSHAKREPKGKCWTTGNLERTSTLYILIMPWEVSVSVFFGGMRGGWGSLKSGV